MGDLISIIVPVYNSALYIDDCVESIRSQTYPYFELLLIDDGSEDNSREVCKKLCGEDRRFRLIERPHKGVSAARNAGIKEAKGKYLFFLDSDDMIHPHLLEELYQLQEKNDTVLAVEGYCRIGDNDVQRLKNQNEETEHIWESTYLDNEQAVSYHFFGDTGTKLYAIGGKMIRHKAIKNANFNEKLTHGEDTLFLYQLIIRGADVSVLKCDWYYYRTHEGGATDIYTVKTCKSRHAVNRYIRDHEIKKGRMFNALRWENATLASIMKWYTVGHNTRDTQLKKYARSLADEERKSEIFSKMDRKRKLDFYLTLYWYRYFQAISTLLHIWHKKTEKWGSKWIWIRRWKQAKYWVWKWIWKICTKLKWKIKGRITKLKWLAREEWAKSWKIRCKVKWGLIGIKHRIREIWDKSWKIRSKIKWGWSWSKRFIKEEWDKAWRIRNKVMWGGIWLKNIVTFPWRLIKKGKTDNKAKVGIITFHCADNYGAMLQSYGLKRYLCSSGIQTDIVPYEPPFMTGRHWWFPYIPIGGLKGCFKWGVTSWKAHLHMKTDFFRLRHNMKQFRRKYLVRTGQGKRLFTNQLRNLPYSDYIVGSDQIWNPAITCGLRGVYFGEFNNKRKKRVIAYAASLGGEALDTRYDEEFSRLLSNVDVISLREEAAIPYIKRFCQGEVKAVLDPVFLLEQNEWKQVEKLPHRQKGYVLVYATELDRNMIAYAKKLSQDTGLEVVELKTTAGVTDEDFIVDYTAGPSEFLGYIHWADYVVTNSFHMVAFSIIFEKKFLAFLHSSFGTRIHNIIRIHGLEDRLCQEEHIADMNSEINWEEVKRRREEYAKQSKQFLMEHIG